MSFGMVKSKGGRGKREALRNDAIKVLYITDQKRFNASAIGRLFQRSAKTIQEILDREMGV